MHTITRILTALAITGTLLVGAPQAATADVPTCDPGAFYTLTVQLADAQAEANDLERQLRRQADQHADEVSDLNDLLLDAADRLTEQGNRHAEELRQLFDNEAEDAAAAREALQQANTTIARRDVRIARLVARVAALKARR